MRAMWAVAVVLCGCRTPEPASTGTITVVKQGSEESPSPPTAPTAQCTLSTRIARIERLVATLPVDVTDDAFFKALLQAIVAVGTMDIVSRDHIAHTVITGRFAGDALNTTCGIFMYRQYALRVVAAGRSVLVEMDCWEADRMDAVYSRPYRPCEVAYGSATDAKIPSEMVATALDLIKLRRQTSPEPVPPPSPDQIRAARWWCAADGNRESGSCYRTREECRRRRESLQRDGVALAECTPELSAACYDSVLVKGGDSWPSCLLNSEACQSQRTLATKRTADVRVLSECRIVR